MGKENVVRLELWVVLFLWICYSFSYAGWGYNQASRLDVLHAVTFHRTVSIDEYHGNTGDKSFYKGHYYSDKAPGFLPLALPGFLIAARVVPEVIQQSLNWEARAWIATALSVGFISACGGGFMFLLLQKYVRKDYALATTIGLFLGSLPFAYATSLFSHAMVIGLLSIALWSVLHTQGATEDMLTGVLTGLAVITEYPAGIAAVGIILLLRFRPKRLFFFACGAVVPLCFLAAYNLIVFDSILSLGYAHVQGWEGMKQGFFGIRFIPKENAIESLLIGARQGLLTWSPFLVLALPGLWHLWKKDRWLCGISIAVFCAQLVCISSYAYWDGGNAVSARHLSPALPFMAIATAYGVAMLPRIAALLITLSLVLIGGATLVEPLTPMSTNPIWNFYLPHFQAGHLEQNVLQLLGMAPLLTALCFFVFEMSVIGLLLRQARRQAK